MNWHRFIALVAGFLLTTVFPVAFATEARVQILPQQPTWWLKWENPGAAKCKGHKDCSVEWALRGSLWSQEVQACLLNKVTSENGTRTGIRYGDRFDFMASANERRGPYLDRQVLAAWKNKNKTEPATYWECPEGEDVVVRLVKPDICFNWAGQKFRVVKSVVPATPAASASKSEPVHAQGRASAPTQAVSASAPATQERPALGVNPGTFVACVD